jgi:hypothetical protein
LSFAIQSSHHGKVMTARKKGCASTGRLIRRRPVAQSFGEIFGKGKLRYEAGFLSCAAAAAEHGTLCERLEVGIAFWRKTVIQPAR